MRGAAARDARASRASRQAIRQQKGVPRGAADQTLAAVPTCQRALVEQLGKGLQQLRKVTAREPLQALGDQRQESHGDRLVEDLRLPGARSHGAQSLRVELQREREVVAPQQLKAHAQVFAMRKVSGIALARSEEHTSEL